MSRNDRENVSTASGEAWLRMLIDSADNQAVIGADADGRILFWSRGADALFGWAEAEVRGKPLSVIFTSNDRDAGVAEREMAQARAEGCAEDVRRYRRRDGSHFWANGALKPLKDGSGGFVKLVRDWTKENQAEEALRESEARFRHLADNALVMVWVSEPAVGDIYLSRTWYEFTGQTPETGLGYGWVEAIHPDDRARAREAFAIANGRRETYQVEYRLRRADGEYRWVISSAAPRFADDGRYLGYVGSVLDIHERRRAEGALREAEERYRLAARATNDLVWDWDLASDQLRWNEAHDEHFGYSQEQLGSTGDWWMERLHPEDRGAVTTGLQSCFEGAADHYATEYRFRRADGSYADIFSRGYIIRGNQGRAVRMVGAMQDLTVRRQTEAQLQRLQSELIHVSRVSAMGTFASTLAHELNQPLTAVTNYVKGAKRLLTNHGADAVPVVVEALDHAAGQAMRASQIMQRLRALVARREISNRPESMDKMVEEAAALALVDARARGVEYAVQLDPTVDCVLIDRIQIQQVLINLIRNALDAMRECSRRVLTISSAPAADGLVSVRVADTGPGVLQTVKDHVFTPFVSTKEDGMGIGLSISRTIIEAHGGQMWVEQSESGGAVFGFTVPRA